MTSTSVIRSLTLSTLMVIAFASVTNGQGGYTIRTVSGEPNFRVTATNGCADEIRLVQQDGADNQPIRWYQFFYLFRGSKIVNIGDLKEGDNVQIDRCNRSLRVSEDGEVKLVNSNDTATIFTIRNLRDVAGEPNSKFVVFEVELKGKRGYFLTNPNTDTNPPTNSKFVLRPGSDYVNNPRNVFKLIYKPSVVDFPSCSGEACNDVFIDGIEGRIYWTNRGNRTIYIQHGDDVLPISPGSRQSERSPDWDRWEARYSLRPRPQPAPPTPASPSRSSEVCPGGPGIIITIGATGNHGHG